MRQIVLIVHNVRSAHNVGSLLRTADGLGVAQVILTGYTPYPRLEDDSRLPHISDKVTARIHKTALGAEDSVKWRWTESIESVIKDLRAAGYEIAALEQSPTSVNLQKYQPAQRLAVIIGNEVSGTDKAILEKCDIILEIPMRGRKESFNVAVVAAMALHHLTSLDE